MSPSSHDHHGIRKPGAQVAPNLLQRDFNADQPNTKWVADTTYIWIAEGWLYLAVVLDLFSRMVGGWSMVASQDATLVRNFYHIESRASDVTKMACAVASRHIACYVE